MDSTLKQLKEHYEEIGGGWNGEDDKYMVGGEIYHEEDAHIAGEIVEHIEAIEKLIGEN